MTINNCFVEFRVEKDTVCEVSLLSEIRNVGVEHFPAKIQIEALCIIMSGQTVFQGQT